LRTLINELTEDAKK